MIKIFPRCNWMAPNLEIRVAMVIRYFSLKEGFVLCACIHNMGIIVQCYDQFWSQFTLMNFFGTKWITCDYFQYKMNICACFNTCKMLNFLCFWLTTKMHFSQLRCIKIWERLSNWLLQKRRKNCIFLPFFVYNKFSYLVSVGALVAAAPTDFQEN